MSFKALRHKMVRICMVSPLPPPYGGIGHWALKLTEYAKRRGDAVITVVDIAPRWRRVHNLSLIYRAIGGGVQFIRDYFRFLLSLADGPQLVHLNTSMKLALLRDIAVLATCRVVGLPSVYHIHFGGVPRIAEKGKVSWWLGSLAIRLSNIALAIDAATEAAIAEHIPRSRVVRIPNFIDANNVPRCSASRRLRKTAVFLGWVVATKGIEELVSAWASLRPSGWRLLIVGPGDVRYQQMLVCKYNPSNVTFAGSMEHEKAMRLLSECDLFLLPTYTEGFPNVILEAMVLSKPIIASSVGAIPEMLGEESGLLVAPKDVIGLKSAIAKMISDEDLRRRFGNNARKRAVNKYTIDVVYQRYVDLWRQAVSNDSKLGQGD